MKDNLKGGLLMCASMGGFALNDAAIKYAASDIGIFQSIFMRGVFASVFIGLIAYYSGAFNTHIGKSDRRWISGRSVAEVIATLSFLYALANMPIASITAILQALPLTVSLAAAVFLSEPLGWPRRIAIGIGLIGVLMIIQPGTADFSIYSIFGLVAVVAVTFRDLIVRKLSHSIPSILVAFITANVICLAGFIAMLIFETWSPMTRTEIILLAIAATFIIVGYYASVAAMRIGEVGFVTPFRYTVMIWAIGLGYFIWGEVPDMLSILGLSIVIGMGLFTLWREARIKS